MFAELLHVRPWEIGELTTSQIDEAVAYFDAKIKEANDGE